jgi:hypothetical protein
MATRTSTYSAVSTALALLSDRQLGELVDNAKPLGSGIGGTSVLLDIEGTPVFVKRVPLTDAEKLDAHSTANLFGLPTFCQYGIGGPGFGVWRELAVHTMTTGWVLDGQNESFPLMYHHRILPQSAQPLPAELRDIDKAVEYWEGSSAVRACAFVERALEDGVAFMNSHGLLHFDAHFQSVTRSSANAPRARNSPESRSRPPRSSPATRR